MTWRRFPLVVLHRGGVLAGVRFSMFPARRPCGMLPVVDPAPALPLVNPSSTSAEATAGHFVLFGALHLAILFGTAALPLALALLVRRRERPALGTGIAVALAAILALDRVLALGWAWHLGRFDRWVEALPMHLCDWATFVVIFALLTDGQRAYETAYFWGLAGTLQAVLTPDTREVFPSVLFLSFFVSHCGIIVGVLFLTWGLGRRPGPGSVWRALGWSQVYLLCAGTTNWLLGTNFGYLARKPANPSLLDFFAPWPWYVLELEGLALLLYGLLYAPFAWHAGRRPLFAGPPQTAGRDTPQISP